MASHSKIIFDELPNVDRLCRLINDIYLVRSASDYDSLQIERELYQKLLYVYRNPISLIEITRLSENDIKNNFFYNKIF